MRFIIKVQAVLRHQRCQVTRCDPVFFYNIKAVSTNNINPAVSLGVFMDQKKLGLWFCTEASKFDAYSKPLLNDTESKIPYLSNMYDLSNFHGSEYIPGNRECWHRYCHPQ